jgi:PAS domain S-box-containing protein
MRSPQSAAAARRAFFGRIRPDSLFQKLFDHLPGVVFFAKDREGRIQAGNAELLRRFGFTREEQILGKTDFDVHPHSRAAKYREDDLAVMHSREPMLRIVELFVDQVGIPDWYVTNKMPIFSHTGEVIGVMGSIQKVDSPRQLAMSDRELAKVLRFVHDHFAEPIAVPALARMVEFSVRHFERWFKERLRTTPRQYITKVRVFQACEELRTGKSSISDIALDCGFYDQSALTRAFHRQMGITPQTYRRLYG